MRLFEPLRKSLFLLSSASRARRTGRPRSFPRVAAESLENRTLLTAPVVAAAVGDVPVYQDQVIRVATGLDQPTGVTSPPNDVSRVFVTEKATGQIKIVDLASKTVLPTPFLDLPDSNLSTVSEQGLVGLTFDPNYATNGYFYVNFTDAAGTTNITRFTVSSDPNVADPNSGRTILTIPQPFSNHNGGWLAFGPDGYLYIAVGDGGSGNDPGNRAQDVNQLLGKILRIDVRGDDFPSDANANYAIPTTNPFVGVAGRDEIWAYGVRNPFRNSFDRATGDLYIADVGQGAREEVDFQRAGAAGGANYGWRLREGTIPTPGVGGPRPAGAVDPVYDYAHGDGQFQGDSITGGYVYRGPIEDLQGRYVFGDFVASALWSISVDRNAGAVVNGSLTDLKARLRPDVGSIDSITSFGEDGAGNLFVVDFGGEIFEVVTDLDNVHTIDLNRVFRDPDGDPLTFSVIGNSDAGSVATQVVGGTLRLGFVRAVPNPVTITVRATDSTGAFTDTSCAVSFRIPAVIAAGSGPGGAPNVRVFDAASGALRREFAAYDDGFTGGVNVATGDVTGDGVPDVVTAAGAGGGPHVKVFDGRTGGVVREFFAYDAGFDGGVNVAVADFDRDGYADIVTGAGAGGGPHVRVFSGHTGGVLTEFFAYDAAFRGGVNVAAGDVDDNGVADVVTGAGGGGGPHVRVFDGTTGTVIREFFAYDAGFRGGVNVTVADVDRDGFADVVTGAGAGGGPHVRVFSGRTGAVVREFFAYDSDFTGGVAVGAADFDRDGFAEIVTGPGPGRVPNVQAFDGRTGSRVRSFDAFDPADRAGVTVASAALADLFVDPAFTV